MLSHTNASSPRSSAAVPGVHSGGASDARRSSKRPGALGNLYSRRSTDAVWSKGWKRGGTAGGEGRSRRHKEDAVRPLMFPKLRLMLVVLR